MQIIDAQVMDPTHLELKSPIKVPHGSKVVISILPPEIDMEHNQWIQISLQHLQSAYGTNEPDYTLKNISILNPEFES